ncbi:MAG: InlB B-repeat-containing protein [Clostridiales bacterium]|nr:InlB B-repeat-containing protein [Clostridiales bacterium]
MKKRRFLLSAMAAAVFATSAGAMVACGDGVDLGNGTTPANPNTGADTTHTVTFIPGAGATLQGITGTTMKTGTDGKLTGTMPTAQKADYTFTGWAIEVNGTSAAVASITSTNFNTWVFTKDTNLHAVFTYNDPNQDQNQQGQGVYTVTFNYGEGDGTPYSATTAGGKLTSLPTPDVLPTDYVFDAWYTEPNGEGDLVTTDYVYTTNTEIYANYTYVGVPALEPTDYDLHVDGELAYNMEDSAPAGADPVVWQKAAKGIHLTEGQTIEFYIEGSAVQAWMEGSAQGCSCTGDTHTCTVALTGFKTNPRPSSFTATAEGYFDFYLKYYGPLVGEEGGYVVWVEGPEGEDSNVPDPTLPSGTFKHGTTDVTMTKGDKGADTCEWQLNATSQTLEKGEKIQFVIGGNVVPVWLEGKVKGCTTCGETHTCVVGIEGFKTNPRPTEFTVTTAGVYDFYLKYYGEYNEAAQSGGYVVWVEGPAAESGGGDVTDPTIPAVSLKHGTDSVGMTKSTPDATDKNIKWQVATQSLKLTKGEIIEFVINGVAVQVWAEGKVKGCSCTGDTHTCKVALSGLKTNPRPTSFTATADGNYDFYLKYYGEYDATAQSGGYVLWVEGPEAEDGGGDVTDPTLPSGTFKHGTTEVAMTKGDKGTDTCEWQLNATKQTLAKGEKIQFVIGGTAVQVWMEGKVKGCTTCGETHTCEIGITGFKTNPRPTEFTVTTAGEYDFYLKYYGEFDGSNGGYVVWAEGPAAEVGGGGGGETGIVAGDYYVVGIGGADADWNYVKSQYHVGKTSGQIELTVTAGTEIKLAKATAAGKTDWGNGELGSAVVTKGRGYLESSDNIKFKLAGTYTIKLVSGSIEITSTMQEPTVELPASKATLKFSNNVTITVAFEMPSWADQGTARIYVFSGGKPVDSVNGGWPGYKMDGSTYTIGQELSKCEIIITMTEGGALKQSKDTATTSLQNGSTFILSLSSWEGDKFILSTVKVS